MGKKARLKKLKMAEDNSEPFYPPAGSKAIPVLKKVVLPVLFILILALGITLRIINLNNVAGRSPDEKIYTYQAKTLVEHGPEGIKLLIQQYNSDETIRLYPIPTRLSYYCLLSSVMKWTKNTDEKVGAYISFVFSVVSLFLLVIIGLRFLNPIITLYALLFMSVSPMDLAIARRTWSDSILGCMGLLLIYFCCELTRNANRLIWYVLFILVGSYILLIKESAILIYGLCSLWILWILFIKEKHLLRGCLFIAGTLLGIGASIFVLSYAAGGAYPVIEVLKHFKEAIPKNIYAIEYQSGPWYYFLQGFWIISPLSAFLCLLGFAGLILPNKISRSMPFFLDDKNRRALLGIAFFAIIFMFISIVTPGFQNLRYVSTLFVPFYLMSGLGLWQIISAIKFLTGPFVFNLMAAIIGIAIIFGAIGDYRIFEKIFARTGILDVSIRMLREFSR